MPDTFDTLLYVTVVFATLGPLVFHGGVLGWTTLVRRLRRQGAAAPTRAPPPTPPLTLAYIVPVYNDARTIGPCIESILAQTRRPDEIIVVDDGSTDPSAPIVASYRHRGVRLVQLERNSGKTSAIEAGLRVCTSDLVAITDSDSLVDPRYVEETIRAFADPDVSAVAGDIESLPHTWVTAARQVDYMMNLKVQKPAEERIGCLFVLPGVSTTYRRCVLLKMGFERDTIAEDIDLTFRLHAARLAMRFNPRALVRTSDPPTLTSYFRQIVRWDTDIWTVVLKHRRQLGRSAFGTVGFPLMMLFHVASMLLVLGVPIYLAFTWPRALPFYYLWQVIWDGAIAAIAALIYRRKDVLWATLSRFPTRVLARIATLVALGRILVGRPLRAWTKLERRTTAQFLAREP